MSMKMFFLGTQWTSKADQICDLGLTIGEGYPDLPGLEESFLPGQWVLIPIAPCFITVLSPGRPSCIPSPSSTGLQVC